MADYTVKEVIPGIFEIKFAYGEDRVGFFGGGQTPHAAWFLPGPQAALIDPGPTVAADIALQAVRDLGHDPLAIEYVVPTHIHVDHGGAAGYLVQQLPRSRLAVHPRGLTHVKDPSRLIEGTAGVFGEQWEQIFGAILPVPEDRLIVVDEGDVLTMGGRRHLVLYTPGHAPHHISLYDEVTGALYGGHGLGMPRLGSPLPDPPSTLPYFDVDASLESIEKMRRLNPRYALLVHYGYYEGDPQALMDATAKATRGMGDIVREALAEGATPEEMERRIKTFVYGDADRADRSYSAIVRAYINYYNRQR